LDFTYIGDLIQGVLLTLTHPQARNQIFNLTYGQSRPINDLVEITKKNFPGVKTEYKERDKLIPFRGTLCIDKAKKLLGYNPAYPIDKGFQQYIDWYKSMASQGGAPHA